MLKGGSILRLHDFKEQGKSFHEISRITGHSRNTVRKYVRDGHTGQPAGRAPKGSILDEFKPVIDQWMDEGLFNCRVILERLRELGYSGGYTIVKDYVHPHRPPKKQKATIRYETKPGEQAQIDWGICEYKTVYGERKKVPVFVMVLLLGKLERQMKHGINIFCYKLAVHFKSLEKVVLLCLIIKQFTLYLHCLLNGKSE